MSIPADYDPFILKQRPNSVRTERQDYRRAIPVEETWVKFDVLT